MALRNIHSAMFYDLSLASILPAMGVNWAKQESSDTGGWAESNPELERERTFSFYFNFRILKMRKTPKRKPVTSKSYRCSMSPVTSLRFFCNGQVLTRTSYFASISSWSRCIRSCCTLLPIRWENRHQRKFSPTANFTSISKRCSPVSYVQPVFQLKFSFVLNVIRKLNMPNYLRVWYYVARRVKKIQFNLFILFFTRLSQWQNLSTTLWWK